MTPSVALGRPTLALPVLVAALGVAACRASPDGAPQSSAASKTEAAAPDLDRPRFVPAPLGDVPAIVRAEVARARGEGRRLVVYEGATWCEPCTHFHEAIVRGELDAVFPRISFLEFDADRDRERLVGAGYASEYIPLFALPGADGRAAGPKAAGGIKGDGAVPYVTRKLQQLLTQGS